MKATSKRVGIVAAVSAASVLAFAPSALAAPKITASKTTGLKAGDTVTVTVSGMTPNESFAVLGLCKPRPALPTDCVAVSTGGAVQGSSDADGNFKSQSGDKSIKLKMSTKAGGVDCTSAAGACVIAVTALGANQAKNAAEVKVTFAAGTGGGGNNGGGGGGGGGGNTGDTGNGNLPNTGSPDGVPTYALVASALVMAGGAALLIIPRRRRQES